MAGHRQRWCFNGIAIWKNGLTVNHRGSYQQHLSTTKFISKKSRVWLSGWKISDAADRELFVHPNSHQPCFQKVRHDFHCRDAAVQDALRRATSKLRSICTSRTTPLKASQSESYAAGNRTASSLSGPNQMRYFRLHVSTLFASHRWRPLMSWRHQLKSSNMHYLENTHNVVFFN